MQVEFSKRAQAQLKSLLINIADYANEGTVDRVQAAIHARIDSLILFPFQYERHRSKKHGEVRRIVVLNKTIVLYRVKKELITIVAFYDARMDWQ